MVKEVEEPEQVCVGRPRLSLREQAFCAIQKVYSRLSSRRAHSLYRNAEGKEQINHAPNFNSINKLLNRPELTPILQRLITVSASPLKTVETDFAIDSTGFQTTRFNDWMERKHGVIREHKWVKAHLICGVKTNVITAATITDGDGADSPQLPYLVAQTASGFQIREASADKAYSGRDNLEAINAVGGVPYIPFKVGTVGKAKGSLLWSKLFHYFQFNQNEFYEHYHKRSNVESTANMVKAKFGAGLKSKNFKAQENELLCKLIAHNIVCVIHETHELGIEPNFQQSVKAPVA